MAIQNGLRVVGVALTYVGLAKLALTMAIVHGTVSPVWPSAGLAVAGLALWGMREWTAILIGAFAANFFVAANPWPVAAGIAFGKTVEAIAGAWVLHHLGVRGEIQRVRDAVAILAVAILAPLPSATAGMLSVTIGGFSTWDRFPWVWFVWWLGDFMGILIVLPLMLAWLGKHSRVRYPPRLWEFAGCLSLGALLLHVQYVMATS